MDFGLEGKVVLVTAGSKGLGFATAKAFTLEGANVIISSRNIDGLRAAREEILASVPHGNVSIISADVSKPTDIERLFGVIGTDHGGVDVLINNAGGPPAGNFDSMTDEHWETGFALTLQSVIRCTRAALLHMRKNKWGRIVNFASSSVKQPIDNLILSNTFRAGVAGLSKSLSVELAKDNILINVLSPGRIATERVAYLDGVRASATGQSIADVQKQSEAMIPLGRYGAPDEFANMAVFLGSSANGYMTGQSILVDGGMVKAL